METYVPRWMRCRLAPPKAATEEEKAAYEESRRRFAAQHKADCREKAKYLNVIPFWGQAAYAAAIAACEQADWSPPSDDVFGPVNQEENQAIAREIARGAPKAPEPPIIDPTPQKQAAYASARSRYERAYSQWKAGDVEAAIPTLSSTALAGLTPEQRKTRAEDVARLTVMAEQICSPPWLQTVIRGRAQELVAQMAEKPWYVSREYVAIGVAALVAAAAAAFASRRRR